MQVGDDGHLVVTYSDGTTQDAGVVTALGYTGHDPLVFVALGVGCGSLLINGLLAYALFSLKKRVQELSDRMAAL